MVLGEAGGGNVKWWPPKKGWGPEFMRGGTKEKGCPADWGEWAGEAGGEGLWPSLLRGLVELL